MVQTAEDGNGVLVNLPHDAMIGGAVITNCKIKLISHIGGTSERFFDTIVVVKMITKYM